MVLTFAESIEQEYLKLGQDAEFVKGAQTLRWDFCGALTFPTGLTLLRKQLNEHVASTRSLHRPGNLRQRAPALARDEEVADELHTGIDMGFDLNLLDEIWPSLWTDGLNNFCVNDNDQGMLNGYLLGLS